eukprot:g33570.t1
MHSAQEFLDNIRKIKIDKEETMVSFDIIALFSSIDMTLAKKTLTILLANPKTQTSNETISKYNMLKLLDLCLTTHFVFNGQAYEQID